MARARLAGVRLAGIFKRASAVAVQYDCPGGLRSSASWPLHSLLLLHSLLHASSSGACPVDEQPFAPAVP